MKNDVAGLLHTHTLSLSLSHTHKHTHILSHFIFFLDQGSQTRTPRTTCGPSRVSMRLASLSKFNSIIKLIKKFVLFAGNGKKLAL